MRHLFAVLLAVSLSVLMGAGVYAQTSRNQDHDSQQPPVEASFPHEDLQVLEEGVVALSQDPGLRSWLGKRLLWHVDLAQYALRRGDGEASIARLDRFIWRSDWGVKRRFMPLKEGFALSTLARSVRNELHDLVALTPNVAPRLFCPEDPACVPTSLIVAQSGARQQADGSPDAPFASIREALGHAAAVGIDCVALHVQAGVYREDTLAIDRDTRILGVDRRSVFIEGSIENHGNHDLLVRNVTLVNSPAPGALVVDALCADTHIESVTIQNATGFGLRQHGGTLDAANLRVSGTAARRTDPDSGSAVFLSGAAHACIQDAVFDRNEGGALLVAGPAALAHVSGLLAVGNRVNPERLEAHFAAPNSAFDGLGTVEVRGGATLTGEFMRLIDSQFIGLYAHRGGRLHARYTNVRGTDAVRRDGGTLGGINAAVLQNGELELTGFLLAGADVCGLLAAQAAVRATDGTVARSPIGACLHEGASGITCIGEGVAYRDNEINLDRAGGPVPPPEPAFPGEDTMGDTSPESPGTCAEVPFAHPWCE